MSKNQQATPQFDLQSIKAAQAMGAAPAEGVSVDKIRDILFGNQMQDYDRRFSGMETLFLQKAKEIEAELNRSIHNVEATGKKQLESIANQVREEQSVRSYAV